MYLNLYNFNVDGIYINRIIPSEVNNNFFDTWKQIQKKYIEELDEVFWGIPTYKIKWYNSDVNGVEGLEKIANDFLEDKKIFDVLKITENETFKKLEQGYLLDLYIPFVDKSHFDLYQSDTEVIIKIGNFKRNIPIPDVIRKYSVDSAKLENERLKIIFR